MPRSKAGKKRSKPCADNVFAAAKRVVDDGLKIREAAREFQVARTTLQRFLAFSGKQEDFFTRCAVWTVFDREEETQLVQYILKSSKMHYGLSRKEVRKLAYEYAKLNNKRYPLTWDKNGLAGEQWYTDFMQRHEAVISLRKPQATSLARATAFNRNNVDLFFDKYSEVMEKHNIPPERIYNIDESGITTVHVPVKVVAGKGVKQVGSMTSGERGMNVTVIGGVNAIGNSVPPMMIFPRVHFKLNMLKGAPPGTLGSAHVSGWSNANTFVEYINHFIQHVKPSPEEKVLLILDNHESHVNINVIDLAKKHGIILLTFPPHTSHKLQPLDRGVFGPLKKYYNTACTEWLHMNSGKPISIYDIAENFGKAYPLAFVPKNIQSGFRVSGIWPINRNIFGEDEFLSSSVTDRLFSNEVQGHQILPLCEPTLQDQLSASTSALPFTPSRATVGNGNRKPGAQLSPEDIRPYPKAGPRKSRGGRRMGRCRVLTDTPEKMEIEAMNASRKLTKRKKVQKQLICESPSLTPEEDLPEDDSNSADDCEWPSVIEQSDDETISKGDFCLTKIMGKKEVHYYVAEIVDSICGEYFVKYLKKVSTIENKFLYDRDDVYDIPKEDIVMKLPPPITIGGSARQCLHLAFGVDFSNYNIK